MFLHSEHMTFAQKVIEGDNNFDKKTQICRNCHRAYRIFCKKFGIESGENISYRLCACQKEVIENRNKQIFAIYPKNKPTSGHYGGKSYQGSEENQYWT